MASKANPSPGKAKLSNEEFLAACIKCAKEKVSVDFDALAKLTGMSSGGASNKFRAIMKQLEAEGATWTKTTGDGDASTKATGTPRKRKNQQAAAADGEDDAADDAVDDESPTKKSKTKRGGAKATKKGVKQEVVKEEEIIKGEENGEEEMEVEDE